MAGNTLWAWGRGKGALRGLEGGEGEADRKPGERRRDMGGRGGSASVVLAFAIALVSLGFAYAGKGYDKMEVPTNLFKGYCVPLEFSTELGLCQGISGTVKVCAAGTRGLSRMSARTWYDLEVNNRASYINNKDLVKNDQSFVKLYRTINTKICRQMGSTVSPRTTLTSDDQQQMACNFVWRRDEEIQKSREEAFSPGDPWGVVRYDPPGANESRWVFKGIPKDQCAFDYDCREANDPGNVHTCCDYCETYFKKYCEVTDQQVFEFCMERIHCVCNSVTKPCFAKYPIYGAACSPAARASPSIAYALVSLAAAFLAFTAR